MKGLVSGVFYENGSQILTRVVVASNFVGRLRGWFGLDFAHYDAVWLTRTNSVHTFFIRQPLELLWLNEQQYCIHQQVLIPGNVAWCRRASSVVEAIPDQLGKLKGKQLVWKPYLKQHY